MKYKYFFFLSLYDKINSVVKKMNNIYLIYGDEDYLIENELKNIIKKNNSSIENISRYNLDESNVRDAVEDALTISMFENTKIIVCEKCNFLTGENKKEVNHDIDSLIKYINNPFDDTILIFVVRNSKLDERKKIVKELKKCSKVIECKSIDSHNLNNYVYNYFKDNGYEISTLNSRLIIDKVKYDLANIISECDKLMMYKEDLKTITKDDIENVVINNMEDSIFSLTNAIMEKNTFKIMNIYNDLLLKGEEEIKLMITIANQFRLILQTKLMIKNGYRERDMASIIGEHPYRVSLALNTNFKISELINYIKKLEQLDYDIKSGNIDKRFGLEFFLLNI